MIVLIVVASAPARLRGRLSNLLLEVQAGVYVGQLNPKGREAVWSLVLDHIEEGQAVMAWPDPDNAAGIDFIAHGPGRRMSVIIDGVRLVDFPRVAPLIGDTSVTGESSQKSLRDRDLEEVSAPRQRG